MALTEGEPRQPGRWPGGSRCRQGRHVKIAGGQDCEICGRKQLILARIVFEKWRSHHSAGYYPEEATRLLASHGWNKHGR